MITANGYGVLALRLTHPLTGNWVASIEVDTEEVLEGALLLEQDDVTLRGTIVRSGVVGGVCKLEAVGGNGGLRQPVTARSFVGSTARAIVADTIAAAGEALSSSSSRPTLQQTLSYWTRANERGGTALSVLADKLAARWRVLQSGEVWFGVDTWPAMAEGYEAVELDSDPAAELVLLAPETIALVPGVTYDSRRVGRVEHVVGRDSPLRTTFWTAT